MSESLDTEPQDLQRALLSRLLREGLLILLLSLSAYLGTALLSYSPADPGWSSTGQGAEVANLAGRAGAWIADVLFVLFGLLAYWVPLLLVYQGWLLLWVRQPLGPLSWPLASLKLFGGLLMFASGCTFAALHWQDASLAQGFPPGGLLGAGLATWIYPHLGWVGSSLLVVALLLAGFTLFSHLSWLALLDWVGRRSWLLGRACFALPGRCRACYGRYQESRQQQRLLRSSALDAGALLETESATANPKQLEREQKKAQKAAAKQAEKDAERAAKEEKKAARAAARAAKKADKDQQGSNKVEVSGFAAMLTEPEEVPLSPLGPGKKSTAKAKSQEARAASKKTKGQGSLFDSMLAAELPSLQLLNHPAKDRTKGFSSADLDAMSRQLEEKLADFGVQAEVVEVSPGPVITRFEIQPAPGIKASRISGLAKDLARSLAIISVRVVEVIPGKSYVGIEVPNQRRELVSLAEVLASREYKQSKSPLTLALGHNISGQSVSADLAKMPHLLVAGTTGSGKSVGINAMLLSLLYKSSPEEVRLILVDPKMLELSVYEGIPHLLTPVITDMKDAAQGLNWCVAEMERRYKLMAAIGVRNISGYNKKVREAALAGQPMLDPTWQPKGLLTDAEQAPALETLPYIVVVIDEFADMMMIVGKKVEQLIARIAQKARAAGIHLILATQRPSVDVITGLIKANIPSRIAFQVSSKIDSRTILDQGGAEQLLGHGDMLFLPPGTSVPERVHGAFVDDDEVHRVVADWAARGAPDYIDVTEPFTAEESSAVMSLDDDPERDDLYDQAVAFVTETRRASISSVQRKFRIGYNRAARLVEAMEQAGVVSSASGPTGNRDVLAPAPVKD